MKGEDKPLPKLINGSKTFTYYLIEDTVKIPYGLVHDAKEEIEGVDDAIAKLLNLNIKPNGTPS